MINLHRGTKSRLDAKQARPDVLQTVAKHQTFCYAIFVTFPAGAVVRIDRKLVTWQVWHLLHVYHLVNHNCCIRLKQHGFR